MDCGERRYRTIGALIKSMFLPWCMGRLLHPLDLSLEPPPPLTTTSSWSFSTESVDDVNIEEDDDEDETVRFRSFGKRRNSVEEEQDDGIPSANKKAAFRKSFDSAVHAVFHSRNGLPLTSSPAPMRRGIKFDFDSGINTPKVSYTFCT
jgi:hypothetical protein